LYNLRASPERRGAIGPGDAALSARLLVTYRPTGPDQRPSPELFRVLPPVTLMSRDDLLALNYPEPGRGAYFVFALEPLPLPAWLVDVDVQAVTDALSPEGAPPGMPLATSWAHFRAHCQRPSGLVGITPVV
jgi:hypothetical protein